MAQLRSGRRPADRRIQVDPPRSPFFRAGPDGVFVARPAAIEPSDSFGRAFSRLRRTMFGRPLSNAEEGTERLSKAKALAVFASDNLSSVAYASEAILFTLLAAGTVTFGLALPISGLIVTVLAIIVVSYRQTIRAYPNVALAAVSILVLAAFGGRVEALIPLYAVGVFTSITLSQAGMVRHWLRERGAGWQQSTAINAIGAVATAIVAVIFAVAKFALGAWLVLIVIPLLIGLMAVIHRRYERRRSETAVRAEVVVNGPSRSQRVIVPVADVTRDVVHAIVLARTMSDDVTAVHVTDDASRGAALRERFERQLPGIPLVIVESPYRSLVQPLVRYLEEATTGGEDRFVIVLLPVYAPSNRLERILFNDNGRRIREALLGRERVLVADVPYRRPG